MSSPSEDLVEQIARVIWESQEFANYSHALTVARAVLASAPIAKYFRDLDHADRISAEASEKVTQPTIRRQT